MPLSILFFINSISLKAHSLRSTRFTLQADLSWAQLLREGARASSPPRAPQRTVSKTPWEGPGQREKEGAGGWRGYFLLFHGFTRACVPSSLNDGGNSLSSGSNEDEKLHT